MYSFSSKLSKDFNIISENGFFSRKIGFFVSKYLIPSNERAEIQCCILYLSFDRVKYLDSKGFSKGYFLYVLTYRDENFWSFNCYYTVFVREISYRQYLQFSK